MSPSETNPLETLANGQPRPAAPSKSNPAVLSASPTPYTLFRALRRRWPWAVGIGAALGIIAALAVWCLPLTTRPGAAAQVHFNAVAPSVLFKNQESKEEFERYARNQAILVKTRSVLDAVLAHSEVADLAVVQQQVSLDKQRAWLDTNLTVDFPASPDVMRILLRGDQTEQLEVVVNAVTREFLEESKQTAKQERQQRLEHLQAQGEKEKAALAELKKSLPGGGGADPSASARLEAAQRDLSALQSEQADSRAQLEARRKKLAGDWAPSDALLEAQLEDYLDRDRTYQRLLAERDKASAAYRKYEVTIKPELFGAKELRELQALDQQLEDYRKRTRGSIGRQVRDKQREQLQTEIERLEERLSLLESKEKLLNEQVRHWAEVIKPGMRTADPDLDRKLGDFTRLEGLVKKYDDEVQHLRVELDAPSRAEQLGKVKVVQADSSKQIQLAGVAGLGIFALSMIGMSFWEFRSRRVGSLDDVAHGLGLKVLGALPQFPRSVNGRLKEPPPPQELAWRHRLHEMMDVTRTLLLHTPSSGERGLQVVLVTSAVGSEGKTTLSSQLAASLARSGRNVLLVDADLRKPTAHRLFDLPGEPGLCEVLRGEVDAGDIIKPTRLGRLRLAPAGTWTALTPQALGQEAVQTLLDGWRDRFDFIVLDSAPVLPVADSLVLARAVDGVIVSVLRDHSCLPQVYGAWQRLEVLGVRLLGVVFSGARVDTYLSDYEQVLPPR